MALENKKLRNSIIWAIVYFLLTIGLIVSSCFLFKSKYYTQIFVSGNSMNPTLKGNTADRVDYGIADTSKQAIDKIGRFDIVVTTYPASWSSDVDGWKIKRVWGLPGEKIELLEKSTVIESQTKYQLEYSVYDKNDALKYSLKSAYYEKVTGKETNISFTTEIKTFNTLYQLTSKKDPIRTFSVHELQDDEYFVMGDNWKDGGSSDSYSHWKTAPSKEYLAKNNLCGNVVCMEGTGKVKNEGSQKVLYDKQPYSPRYFI